ncbi:MAG: acyltransferase family protein [Sphingomonadaceae bacterium]
MENEVALKIGEPARAAANERTKRIAWIDTARGVGIILVVVAHAQRGLIKAGVLPSSPTHMAADATIYAFHMPLFFLLAGLHVAHGIAAGRSAFFKDKLATIAWPYFLWSCLHIITVMIVADVNQPLGLADLVATPWHPVAQFWFLYALFLCHLIALALWQQRWALVALAILFVAAQAAFGIRNIALHMMQVFPFFLVGALAGPWLIERIRRIPLSNAAIAMAAGWLVLVMSRFAVGWTADAYPTSSVIFYLGASAGIIGVMGLSVLLGNGARWLQRMGQASMAIFVMHTFFTAGLRFAVYRAGLPIDPLLLLVASSLLGIVGPWLIYEYAGPRKLTVRLGLGKYVRS